MRVTGVEINGCVRVLAQHLHRIPKQLNAFFLLLDKPEVYNLPPEPVVPTKKAGEAWASMAAAAAGVALAAIGSVLFSRWGGRA